MAYNSNHIESSGLDEEQTRCIYETRAIDAENIRLDDVIETVGSFELFDTMLDHVDEPITAETMKAYHAILKRWMQDAFHNLFVSHVERIPSSEESRNGSGDIARRPR